MKTKKRKKTSRIRGARTCGWGFRQKHKGGHGNSGGAGMSGSGKRGDQKKQFCLNIARKAGLESYFGKKGFTSRNTEKNREKCINLIDIKNNFLGKEINLKEYKILGKGEGFKAVITAKSASKSAIEKMEKADGKIIVKENKKEASGEKGKKEVVKEEKPVKEKAEKKKPAVKSVGKK